MISDHRLSRHRNAIARAIWMMDYGRSIEAEWLHAKAWYEEAIAAQLYDVVALSRIGSCFQQADKILAVLKAAGLTATKL